MQKNKAPIFLALIWLIFTASLVGWWWWHGVHTAHDERIQRMLFWEGGFLLLVVLAGGGALVFYTSTNLRRHARLQFFFSTFAHDLKTSISRLRLQAEVLEENHSKTPELEKLMGNIQRLDLQLENSLWIAGLGERTLFVENLKLSDVIRSLKTEFPDLKIDLKRDAIVKADQRALQVVLRNLLQNSIIHGEATAIVIEAEAKASHIHICVSDNGKGVSEAHLQHLGKEPLHHQNSHSNGIGLYLTRRLLKSMKGDYQFTTQPFTNIVILEGALS